MTAIFSSSVFNRPLAPLQNIDGHWVRSLPGGIFPMGGRWVDHPDGRVAIRPSMVQVPPFRIGVTPVTVDQYFAGVGTRTQPGLEVTGTIKADSIDLDGEMMFLLRRTPVLNANTARKPVVNVSYRDIQKYLKRFNKTRPPASRASLPSLAQWQFAARGDAIDVRAMMDDLGLTHWWSLVDFLHHFPVLEYFTGKIQLGTKIYTDIHSDGFRQLLSGKSAVYGWRTHATPDGAFSDLHNFSGEGLWDVDPHSRLNGFGLSDMMGQVREMCGDLVPSDKKRRKKLFITSGAGWTVRSGDFLRAGAVAVADDLGGTGWTTSLNELWHVYVYKVDGGFADPGVDDLSGAGMMTSSNVLWQIGIVDGTFMDHETDDLGFRIVMPEGDS